MLKTVLIRATAFSLVMVTAGSAGADEGLWTIDAFPADRVKATYGLDIGRAWLDHTMKASVRLSSRCSASLVSGTGLVLTNNHCVSDCAKTLSTSGKDFYSQGFVATAPREEKRCLMGAEVVISITDVTDRVMVTGRRLTGAALSASLDAAKTKLANDACADDARRHCEVIDMYNGARFTLYQYRKYDDVRLVFSPGVAAQGLKGGRFPAFDFDAAFLRLYENGKPSRTPNHLSWSAKAPSEGDLVFVAGNPRVSERMLTVSQLKTKRDMANPLELVQAAELIGLLTRFGQESDANRLASQFQLWDLQNHYGYVFELQKALSDEAFFAQKVREEADLRASVGLAGQAPWAAIEAAEGARRSQSLRYDYLAAGPSSELFTYARLLVRGAMERMKTSADRLPGYTDDQLPLRKVGVFKEQALHVPLEQLQLEFWLDSARRYLSSDEATLDVMLGSDSPETLAARLAQSKLGDVAVRRRLWEGGLPTILASDDPMIRYMLRIDPLSRTVRAKWIETVYAPEAAAAEWIARARFAAYGTKLYPDANRTLRISFGKVAGVTEGDPTPAFTTIGGMFERGAGDTPYKLDPRWLAAKGKLNPEIVMNLSTTNDGINGNSGSPLLNSRGEVVGTFWGGNDAAMAGNYGYEPKLNRAVALSTAAIGEVLGKVYGGNSILKELRAN